MIRYAIPTRNGTKAKKGIRLLPHHLFTPDATLLNNHRDNAHINQRSSHFFQFANLTPNRYSFVFVGGGPRAAMCSNAFIATLMAHQNDIHTLRGLGAEYDINLTIIDGQDKTEMARGNSFGSEHTGISNTGVNWQLTPRLAPSADRNIATVLNLGNIADKVRHSVQSFVDTEKRMKKTNRVAAIMFKDATTAASTTPNQFIGLDTACLMRKDVGEALLTTFTEFCATAKHSLPYLKLNIQANTKVFGLGVGNDSGLAVTTQNKRNGARCFIKADMVHLFTGTTLTAPEVKSTVRSMTYCGYMTPARVSGFLDERHLLVDGRLKAGSKILIGGTNLSAIDAMTALEPYMGLVEECPSEPGGFRINKQAAEDYVGAITFVSNQKCLFANPRVSFGEGWTQKHDAFGTSHHLHALFLHEFSQDLCNVWTIIQKAAIARTNGILASQAIPTYENIKEQLAHMYLSSLTYFENMEMAGHAEHTHGPKSEEKKRFLNMATHTLYGARMQAASNRTSGFGFERDLAAVRKSMSEFAPITWAGRHGWLFDRAQLAAITDPSYVGDVSNEELYNDWSRQSMDLTPSPPAMHSFIAKLSEAGVVNFVTSNYATIENSSSTDKLMLQGETYDAFLVSPVFNRDVEDTSQTLAGQVTPVHPDLATHPKVGKHRALVSRDGKLTRVEDYGMSGVGAKIRHADGSWSHVNAFANDVNTLASAVDSMPSVAMRMTAAAHLGAAGINDPWCLVRKLYEECTPSVTDYDAEVAKFAPFFQEAHEMAIFYTMLEQVSEGDAEAFAEGYDSSGSKIERNAYLEKMSMSSCRHVHEAQEEHERAVRAIPSFHPASRDEYFARFVDSTEDEDIRVYQRSMEVAKDYLSAGTKAVFVPGVASQPKKHVSM